MNFDMFELIDDEEVLLEDNGNYYLQFAIIYDGIGGELKYYPQTDEFEITTYITDISDYDLDDEERKELRQIIEEYCYDELGMSVLNLYEFLTSCFV